MGTFWVRWDAEGDTPPLDMGRGDGHPNYCLHSYEVDPTVTCLAFGLAKSLDVAKVRMFCIRGLRQGCSLFRR